MENPHNDNDDDDLEDFAGEALSEDDQDLLNEPIIKEISACLAKAGFKTVKIKGAPLRVDFQRGTQDYITTQHWRVDNKNNRHRIKTFRIGSNGELLPNPKLRIEIDRLFTTAKIVFID